MHFTKQINLKQCLTKMDKVIIIVCCIFICISIALLYGAYAMRDIPGNTIGNIRNYGYATEQDGWIYYLAPNEESTQVGIFKIRNNGQDKQQLYMSALDIVSLNIYKDNLYFIGVSIVDNSELTNDNESDELDNKIYKMNLDGSNLKVINDNEFSDDCYEIYAVRNKIYYIGIDGGICTMNLDGTGKTKLSIKKNNDEASENDKIKSKSLVDSNNQDKLIDENNQNELPNNTGYLGITENYIIYNVLESEDAEDYVTYIMNIDGTESRPIIAGKRLYSVNVEGNYIYYTNEYKKIYRTKIDSNTEELVFDTVAYNLNTSGKYAYYLNYVDPEKEDYTVCIYRVKLNGKSETPEVVKKMSSYSSFIDIIGKWIIYMDSDDSSGFMDLVKVDGSGETIQLYYLNYDENSETSLSSDASSEDIDEANKTDIN